jgi:hypothetical protein
MTTGISVVEGYVPAILLKLSIQMMQLVPAPVVVIYILVFIKVALNFFLICCGVRKDRSARAIESDTCEIFRNFIRRCLGTKTNKLLLEQRYLMVDSRFEKLITS